MAFLIDKYLPQFTFKEHHEKLVNASCRQCFAAATGLDMSKSFITKTLMKLRGLPVKDSPKEPRGRILRLSGVKVAAQALTLDPFCARNWRKPVAADQSCFGICTCCRVLRRWKFSRRYFPQALQ